MGGPGPGTSPRELFRLRCYLVGITEPETVARLWVVEKAAADTAAARAKATAAERRRSKAAKTRGQPKRKG